MNSKGNIIFIMILLIAFSLLLTATIYFTFFAEIHQRSEFNLYDMYTLVISWFPTLCLSKLAINDTYELGKKCFFNVMSHPIHEYSIHGLWPSFKDQNKSMDFCHPLNNIYVDIKDSNLNKSLKHLIYGTLYPDILTYNHQYNKHGFCYSRRNGIDRYNSEPYFKFIYDIYKQINFTNFHKKIMQLKSTKEIVDYNNDAQLKTIDVINNIYNMNYLNESNKLSNYSDRFRFYNVKKEELMESIRENIQNKSGIKVNNDSFIIYCMDLRVGKETYQMLYDIRVNLELNNSLSFVDIPQSKNRYYNCKLEDLLYPVPKQVFERFDVFVLSMFWPIGTCRSLEKMGEIERSKYCLNNTYSLKKNTLIIHGLWPSFLNEELPPFARPENDIEITKEKLGNLREKMEAMWKNVYRIDYDYLFWKHEFNKHGYAYNQYIKESQVDNYVKYFEDTINFVTNNTKGSYLEIMDKFIQNQTEKINKNIYNNIYDSISKPKLNSPIFHTFSKDFFKNFIRNKYMKSNNETIALLCFDYKYNNTNMSILNEIRFSLNKSNFEPYYSGMRIEENCPENITIEIPVYYNDV